MCFVIEYLLQAHGVDPVLDVDGEVESSLLIIVVMTIVIIIVVIIILIIIIVSYYPGQPEDQMDRCEAFR